MAYIFGFVFYVTMHNVETTINTLIYTFISGGGFDVHVTYCISVTVSEVPSSIPKTGKVISF